MIFLQATVAHCLLICRKIFGEQICGFELLCSSLVIYQHCNRMPIYIKELACMQSNVHGICLKMAEAKLSFPCLFTLRVPFGSHESS